jgi:hypothetical protein
MPIPTIMELKDLQTFLITSIYNKLIVLERLTSDPKKYDELVQYSST